MSPGLSPSFYHPPILMDVSFPRREARGTFLTLSFFGEFDFYLPPPYFFPFLTPGSHISPVVSHEFSFFLNSASPRRNISWVTLSFDFDGLRLADFLLPDNRPIDLGIFSLHLHPPSQRRLMAFLLEFPSLRIFACKSSLAPSTPWKLSKRDFFVPSLQHNQPNRCSGPTDLTVLPARKTFPSPLEHTKRQARTPHRLISPELPFFTSRPLYPLVPLLSKALGISRSPPQLSCPLPFCFFLLFLRRQRPSLKSALILLDHFRMRPSPSTVSFSS